MLEYRVLATLLLYKQECSIAETPSLTCSLRNAVQLYLSPLKPEEYSTSGVRRMPKAIESVSGEALETIESPPSSMNHQRLCCISTVV